MEVLTKSIKSSKLLFLWRKWKAELKSPAWINAVGYFMVRVFWPNNSLYNTQLITQKPL